MRNATKWLLVAVLGLGLSTTARAQSADSAMVTFQVDLSMAIDNCAFSVDTSHAYIRGAFNDWSTADTLTRVAESNIFAGTLKLKKGTTYEYKFFGSGTVNYEDGSNRSYTVTQEDTQTLDAVSFNKTFTSQCGVTITPTKYRFLFTVDMSVARLDKSQFNDDANDGGDDIVVVAGGCKPDSFSGCLNGWSTTADTLQQDFFNPNLYSKAIEVENFPVPSSGLTPNLGYKFVIGQTPGEGPGGWESINDRIFDVTGSEAVGADGYREVALDTVFYNNVDDSQIFTEETQIVVEVDLRPAYYYVTDNGELPPDTQSGERTGTAIDGVALNGPAAGRALSNNTGIVDWADWGPTLAQIPARNFNDAGQDGDTVSGDSVFTQTFTYPAGTPKTVVGKFGLNGYDNEAVANTNHYIPVGAAADNNGRVRMIFGAVRNEDGTFTDQKGPILPGGTSARPVYDPYIAISNDSLTVTVVRRGGEATTAIEDLGLPADGFTVSAAQPNPFTGQATFTYALPQAQHVTVRVYDVTGRVVATLVDAFQAASTYAITFDGDGLAAGMYFYQVQSATQARTGQMVLVR